MHTNSRFNEKIEAIQYNSALAITGCVRGTSRERLYSELGLNALYDRRRFHRLTFHYKINNNLTPAYLRNFIPASTERLCQTRTNRDNVIPSRTLKYRYSFFPDTTHAWNLLSDFIKSSPSLSIFKKRLLTFFNSKPNFIYDIHNPVGLRYLTRLRVGLSHLRSHKYHHKFKDTENDICPCDLKVPETVEHYLLYCPKYNLIRSELFEKLTDQICLATLISPSYTVNLLLYGKTSLEFSANKKVLELTINYVIASKRFDGPFITN